MKVLYLSEWYPHRRDAMSGLFVRKHAIACVRQGIDVCVLFIMKDTHDDIIIQTTDGVREVYVYHTGNYYKALYKGWQTLKCREYFYRLKVKREKSFLRSCQGRE